MSIFHESPGLLPNPSHQGTAASSASLAPAPMAIPTSAAVSATASLTPSPTKTTRRPDVWSSATKAALWAGAHSARTWDGSFWLIKAKGRYKGIWNDMDMGIYPSWNLWFFCFNFILGVALFWIFLVGDAIDGIGNLFHQMFDDFMGQYFGNTCQKWMLYHRVWNISIYFTFWNGLFR